MKFNNILILWSIHKIHSYPNWASLLIVKFCESLKKKKQNKIVHFWMPYRHHVPHDIVNVNPHFHKGIFISFFESKGIIY